MPHPLLERRNGMPPNCWTVGVAERRRQRRKIWRRRLAQPDQRRVGAESVTEREDRRRAAGEVLGEQAVDRGQRAAHQADAAAEPAHGARRLRTSAAQRPCGGS